MTEFTSDFENSAGGINTNVKTGYWAAIIVFILMLFYLAVSVAAIIPWTGLPPIDPYLTLISVDTVITAVAMVFLWSALHTCAPANRKVFSQCSLAMVTILATLTCITRYVQMSMVPQALAAGKTEEVLEWFMVYGEFSMMADIELLAWGGFLGLALLFLAPVFRKRKLERSLFWTLIISGPLCLIAAVGKAVSIPPLMLVGFLGWGLGLAIATGMMVFWFREKLK